MKNSLAYLIICSLCLVSCKTGNPAAENKVIDLEEAWTSEGSVMLSEIASSIDYIPLQKSSDPASILPDENRINVRMAGDNFIIYGRESVVKVFSGQGEFLRTIGNIGRGPGEYLQVDRVLVSPDENDIWIFEGSHKLINYSLEGFLKKELSLAINVAQVTIDPKGNLYLMHLEYDRGIMDSSKIEVINAEGEILDQFPLYSGRRLGPGRSWYLYSRLTYRDGALEHFEPPYDTLFRYEDKAWQAEWILEIGPNKIPFDAYTDAMRFNEVLADYTFISSLFETKDYFFIRGVVKRAMKMVLADKNSLEARNCVYTNEKLERPFLYQGLINDIDGGFPFWPRSYYKDEYLLTLVGAMDLLDFKPAITDRSSFQKKDREKLENLVQNIDLEANPVIMLVKLK